MIWTWTWHLANEPDEPGQPDSVDALGSDVAETGGVGSRSHPETSQREMVCGEGSRGGHTGSEALGLEEVGGAAVADPMAVQEHGSMDRAAERRALAEVQARLEERFPELHPDVIAAAVQLAHSELEGPVRDFVPLLVEHAARDRLAFALRAGDIPGDAQTSSAAADG